MIFTIHIILYLRGHVQVSDETLMMGVIAPLAGRLRVFVNTPLQLGPSAWQTVRQNQRVYPMKNPIKPPFSYGFPMVFPTKLAS